MSKIEWTSITANPIHLIREDGSNGGHFCNKVSPGCLHCFAEEMNQSNYFKFASHLPYSGSVPQNLIFDDKVMEDLVKMRSPKKVFLCSMTDLFGEWVSDDWLDRAFAYMARASQHTFQILTKRPERLRPYLQQGAKQRIRRGAVDLGRSLGLAPERYEPYETCNFDWPLPNVWLGTSVENQKAADDRISQLQQSPAAVHFLSCEPLLGAIDLRKYLGICSGCQSCEFLGGHQIGKSMLDWVIVGGESGTGARACEIDWIKSIVYQCQQSKTAVFVKQLGSVAIKYNFNGTAIGIKQQLKLKDRKGGNIDDFPPELRVREFPS